jgi:hypothetical protein
MKFRRESTLGEILDHEEAKALFIKFAGEEVLMNPMLEMGKGMTLEQITNMTAPNDPKAKADLDILIKQLEEIK